MKTPKHGEIWIVDFSPARGSEQAGLRPALIIQNNIGNHVSGTTIIAAVSTNLRSNPTNVLVKASQKTGLNQDSMIKTSQLLTVSKDRLIQRLGTIDAQAISEVNKSLRISLAFD